MKDRLAVMRSEEEGGKCLFCVQIIFLFCAILLTLVDSFFFNRGVDEAKAGAEA